MRYMKALPEFASNVLTPDEQEAYDLEVRQLHIDTNLPDVESETRLDSWWTAVHKLGKYNTVCKIVFAFLSCFHGPMIEGSFSTMSNIINP